MLPTVELRIRLHRAQKLFRDSKALYRGFVGGRGAGKSWIGAYDMIRRAKPGHTYLIASPTGVKLHDETYPTFKAIAEMMGRWGPVKLTPYPTVQLTTGATIRFRSAEDPEKMRGPNLSGVWLDEASLMEEAAFKICIACLREHGEQGWLSASFTPKGLSHWTYEKWGKVQPNTAIFHAETHENPFLPPDFEDTLRQQYTGLYAEQELGGRFVAVEGAEWRPEYFPDSIWFTDWPTPPHWIATALALDPSKGRDASKPREGRKPDFSAYVWGGVDAHGGVWIDADLDQTRDVSRIVQDGIAHFRRFLPGAFVVEINQFQSLLATELARQGKLLNLHLPLWGIVNAAPDSKTMRIQKIGPYLARRELHFRDTPGCRLLVAQLRDFPMGAYDDGPDALEMLIRMLLHQIRGRTEGGSQPQLLRS